MITQESAAASKPAGSVLLVVCAAIVIAAGLYFTRSIFAPAAFALFAIAIVWPMQKMLETRVSRFAALPVTLLLTIVVIAGLGGLIAWGLGQIGHWAFANTARFQAIYLSSTQWLEEHGIFVVGIFVETFNVMWLVRVFQEIALRVNYLIGFSLLVFIFTTLGILEVPSFKARLERMGKDGGGRNLSESIARISAKFRRYMLIRTVASVLTGVTIWVFTLFVGLELATAWGVIAFALNYIPFLGPAVAMVLPALLAIIQFESWQMVVFVFLGLGAIQFYIGSYLEPRLAGATLSISPFLVLLSVFFWSFLWGIPGAFIGVPLTIAFLTICEQYPQTRWIATLLSGPGDAPDAPST
ncbi:AI-2E family transporter [Ancylobacter terrae]|uniref:AI-2E family transporter n=1 Tax=Ancylobacter sp. sgz301288 TaxID=3342077 RepID=UPI0038598378